MGRTQALVTVPVTDTEVTEGDVVAFRPPSPGELFGDHPVLHGVTAIGTDDGRARVVTKRDTNRRIDPWRSSLPDADLGQTGAGRATKVPPANWQHLGRHRPRPRRHRGVRRRPRRTDRRLRVAVDRRLMPRPLEASCYLRQGCRRTHELTAAATGITGTCQRRRGRREAPGRTPAAETC